MIRDEAGQDLLIEIGKIFVNFRQEAGLTQRQAAELAESTQARLSYLENGERDVLILTLLRWANAYGYNLEVRFVPIEDEETKTFNDALAEAMADLEMEE